MASQFESLSKPTIIMMFTIRPRCHFGTLVTGINSI